MPSLKITVPGDYPQPYRFALSRRRVTIGRASDNDIPVASDSVSHQHSEIHRVIGGFELRDCGSTNGVRSAGKRVERLMLSRSESLLVGEATLDFILNDEEVAELAAETAAAADPREVLEPAADTAQDDGEEQETGMGAGLTAVILLALLGLAGLAVFAAMALR